MTTLLFCVNYVVDISIYLWFCGLIWGKELCVIVCLTGASCICTLTYYIWLGPTQILTTSKIGYLSVWMYKLWVTPMDSIFELGLNILNDTALWVLPVIFYVQRGLLHRVLHYHIILFFSFSGSQKLAVLRNSCRIDDYLADRSIFVGYETLSSWAMNLIKILLYSCFV